MQPYRDPVRDQIDHLENSIQLSLDGGGVPCENPEIYMDGIARRSEALECSIEGTEIPPTVPVDLAPFAEPDEAIGQGSFSEAPPLLSEPVEPPWIQFRTPLPAKPYTIEQGLTREPHQSRGRAGTGSKGISLQHNEEVYCRLKNEWISKDECSECEYYDPESETCEYHEDED